MDRGPADGPARVRRRDAALDYPCLAFEAGQGRSRLWGTAQVSDGGLRVDLLGGDVPHVGAVAIGIPRPSLAVRNRRSATTSVFAVVGHKEDELARSMATELARRLGVITVVVAGVHLVRARPADIARVVQTAEACVESIVAAVRRWRRGAGNTSGSGERRGGRT
jgi:gallate decarboxylase subunit D